MIGADFGSAALDLMTSYCRVTLPTCIDSVVVVTVCRSTALMMCTPANVAPPSVTTNAVIRTRKRPIIFGRRTRSFTLQPFFFGAYSRPGQGGLGRRIAERPRRSARPPRR